MSRILRNELDFHNDSAVASSARPRSQYFFATPQRVCFSVCDSPWFNLINVESTLSVYGERKYIRSAPIWLGTECNIQRNLFPDWLSSYLTKAAVDFEFILSANHGIHQWKINCRFHHCKSDSWTDSGEGFFFLCSTPRCSSLGLFQQGIWWYLQSESISGNFSHVNTWLSPLWLNMNEAD